MPTDSENHNQTAESTHGESSPSAERIPVMQQLLDNPFLLLFIGVTMPTVFYIIWGIMEIVTIPVAP